MARDVKNPANNKILVNAKARVNVLLSRSKNRFELLSLKKTGLFLNPDILLDKEIGLNRDKFSDDLRKLNIDTRPVFPSISQYPIWGEQYRENKNSN